jgi:hypothetical protein
MAAEFVAGARVAATANGVWKTPGQRSWGSRHGLRRHEAGDSANEMRFKVSNDKSPAHEFKKKCQGISLAL